jgi:monothiol glutaredoxin
MALSDKTKQRIEGLVASDKVVVFMKGNRGAPQCGFSSQVVQILDSQLSSYTTVDVLQDPEVRQGIKDFTNWPTIPQVYVNGEFVGGCDILTELYQSGELEGLLGSGS